MTLNDARSRAGLRPQPFVFVHGAWHGGWCWKRVATRLRAHGHAVFTPTLTGLGERRHLLSADITLEIFAEDVANVIEAEELSGVILVGHSFAGAAISSVAERMPECIAGLVYLDALMIEPGGTAFDAFSSEEVAQRTATAMRTSGGLSLPPPSPEAFGVFEQEDTAWLRRRLTPQPFSVYHSKHNIMGPVGNGRPATYVGCVAPEYSALAPSRSIARQLPGIQYIEKPWSHDPMVTNPKDLSEMLVAFAATLSQAWA